MQLYTHVVMHHQHNLLFKAGASWGQVCVSGKEIPPKWVWAVVAAIPWRHVFGPWIALFLSHAERRQHIVR